MIQGIPERFTCTWKLRKMTKHDEIYSSLDKNRVIEKKSKYSRFLSVYPFFVQVHFQFLTLTELPNMESVFLIITFSWITELVLFLEQQKKTENALTKLEPLSVVVLTIFETTSYSAWISSSFDANTS